MAITSSAKKAIRADERKAVFNIRRKRAYKTAIKDIEKDLKDNKVADAEKKLPAAYKAIDKAAKMGTLHKNTAARTKSRLVGKIKRVKGVEKK